MQYISTVSAEWWTSENKTLHNEAAEAAESIPAQRCGSRGAGSPPSPSQPRPRGVSPFESRLLCGSHPHGLLPARLFAVLRRLLLFPTSDGIYLHVIICSGSFDLHFLRNCSVVTLWTTRKYQFKALAENIIIVNPNKKVLIGLLVILSRSHNRFLCLFTTAVLPPHPSKSALDLINL